MKHIFSIAALFFIVFSFSCNTAPEKNLSKKKDTISCMNTTSRFAATNTQEKNIRNNGDSSTAGMVYIPGGNFMMGADNRKLLLF